MGGDGGSPEGIAVPCGPHLRVVTRVDALMAYAAFDGKDVEIDSFGLDRTVLERLQIVVFVKSDSKF